MTASNTSVRAHLLIGTLTVKCFSCDTLGVSRQEAAVLADRQAKSVPLTHSNPVLTRESGLDGTEGIYT